MQGSMFNQIYGKPLITGHDSPPTPNRAQRRARAKYDRAAQKRGQRAYEASQAKEEK